MFSLLKEIKDEIKGAALAAADMKAKVDVLADRTSGMSDKIDRALDKIERTQRDHACDLEKIRERVAALESRFEATIERAQPLWDLSDAGGVDVVLNGHDHIYERFAPIDGITSFVVGSGGKELYELGEKAPRSQVQFDDRMGVLRLTLSSDGRYDYAFIDSRTGKAIDAGSQRCTNDPTGA